MKPKLRNTELSNFFQDTTVCVVSGFTGGHLNDTNAGWHWWCSLYLLDMRKASYGRALAVVLGHSFLEKPPVASHCSYGKEKKLGKFLLSLWRQIPSECDPLLALQSHLPWGYSQAVSFPTPLSLGFPRNCSLCLDSAIFPLPRIKPFFPLWLYLKGHFSW